MLTHLNEDTVHSTKKHTVLGLETVEVTSRLGELVLFDTLDDLIHLASDFRFVGLVSTELGEVDLGLLDVSTLNVETRRLGGEGSSEEDEAGKDELNGDREAPRESIVTVVERVVDGVREEAARDERDVIRLSILQGHSSMTSRETHIPTVAMSW